MLDTEDSSSWGAQSGGSTGVVPQRSMLDLLLLAEWEDRVEQVGSGQKTTGSGQGLGVGGGEGSGKLMRGLQSFGCG